MGMYTVQIYCPGCDAWRPVRHAQKTLRDNVRPCRLHMAKRSWDPEWRIRDANGYVRIRVGPGTRGIVYEHRHVWEQANGAIPPGHHVHHRNHDKSDNRIENLQLLDGRVHVGSHSKANHRKGIIDNVGDKSGQWRHDLDDRYIRSRRQEGASFRQIGRELGVCHGTVINHYRSAPSGSGS